MVLVLQMKLSVLVLLGLLALSSASLQDIIKKSSQLRKGNVSLKVELVSVVSAR